MAERRVRQTEKDPDRGVLSLAYDGQPWSPRTVEDVIEDIRRGIHTYFVQETGPKIQIHVIETANGPTLRSTADPRSGNNLGNLPDA